MWNIVTFLGDSSITVPAALVIYLWLCSNRFWRQSLRWGFWFGLTILFVSLTKIMFMGWQITPALLNFTGVSGHAASATTLYLTLALLYSHAAPHRKRLLVIGGTLCLVLLIAISRLAIKVHSPSEVVAGVALGIISALLFARGFHTPAANSRPLAGRPLVTVLLVLVMLATNGRPAPTQDLLTKIAMSLSGRSTVYGRTQPL